MRYLFLTYGAPGSGKSTFIQNNHLEKYTVATDNVRELAGSFQTRLEADELNGYAIASANETFVWQTVYKMVEHRMQTGITTFVDGTHLYRGAFREYRKLARKYHYQIIVVDFMRALYEKCHHDPQTMIAKLAQRDKQRKKQQQRFVGQQVISKYIDRYFQMKNDALQELKVISPEDCQHLIRTTLTNVSYQDFNRFERIKIIGDIHGEHTGLQEIFADHQRGTAYIFCGDILDRGTQNLAVLEFINRLKGNNLFFIRGNHEDRIDEYLTTGKLNGQFGRHTYPQLLEQVGSKEQLDNLLAAYIKRLVPYVALTFGKKNNIPQRYFVSHAGIEPALWTNDQFSLYLTEERSFTLGVAPDPYARNVDELWNQTSPSDDVVQLHGHRNNFNVALTQYTTIYNLTSDNELRYVTLTKKGINNQVCCTPYALKRQDLPNFVEQLQRDPDIRQVELTSGIIANNFTREVFNNNRWTPNTTNARGLFTRENEIVGRGFKKFFNVGQTPEARIENVGFPARIYRKYNGFLAIALWDHTVNQVRAFTKGGSQRYAEIIQRAFAVNQTNDQLKQYYAQSVNQQTSVLFEIIDVQNNEHIVDYSISGKDYLAIPLAIIDNDEKGRVRLDLMDQYSELWASLGTYHVANNLTELTTYIEQDRQANPHEEGVVIYGQNMMLKVKYPYYLKARELRTALKMKKKRKHWVYGAKEWYKAVKQLEKEQGAPISFNPKLPLELEKKLH